MSYYYHHYYYYHYYFHHHHHIIIIIINIFCIHFFIIIIVIAIFIDMLCVLFILWMISKWTQIFILHVWYNKPWRRHQMETYQRVITNVAWSSNPARRALDRTYCTHIVKSRGVPKKRRALSPHYERTLCSWNGANDCRLARTALAGSPPNGPFARYITLRIAHASGMPGTYSPPLTSKETTS